ncbi:transposase [candidate division MSBL1 archaeon SCGC-AAA259E19]|uniref:Transposase n=2 Tax=candidate division MSBL1 TaxID=215777 RepID=A0A133UH20_9EURY|nr:transposase [candidate division MSBL1 archaeon SCGC-AAA259E19]KXA93504.1 transposase [candidate division MSBL1 archaeon SCGC-AAA259E17]
MGEIKLTEEKVILTEDVETIYEKEVTPFGTSAKIGCYKKYIGKKALVVILKEE